MHGLDVALHLLAAAARHDGLAVVVHREHELVRLLLGVAEVVAEHIRDVGHQIDRIVPDDGDPRILELDDLINVGLRDLNGRRCGHTAIVSQPPDEAKPSRTLES